MLHIDFLNKNMLRKYPIKGISRHVTIDERDFPMNVIVGAQLSAPYIYRRLYISKIYVRNNYINVTIRDVDMDTAIGCFAGFITSNFQTFTMESFIDTVTGTMTFGFANCLELLDGTYVFSFIDGEIEESLIFVYTPPAVTAFINEDGRATGNIEVTTVNLTLTSIDSNTLDLTVINPELIMSNSDFAGEYDNCPTPVIKQINTVTPNPATCNIDIYGIEPLVINVNALTGLVELSTPTLDIVDVCPEKDKLQPPEDTSVEYYANFLTVQNPEWKTWPHFN